VCKEEFSNAETTSISFDFVKRLLFGINMHKRISEILSAMKTTKPLIVTDKGIVHSGILDKIKIAVEGDGVSATVWDEVVTEPTVESMDAVKEFVREGDFDLVIGLGGGSSMDTAKMAALMKYNVGNTMDYFEKKFEKPRLPLILIPTTSGTGSEMTGGIVFSVAGEKRWYGDSKALPDIALVDPVLTVTMPARVTAHTGLDALGHAVEALMTIYASPLSDAFAYTSIKWVVDHLERAYHQGKDITARYYMSLSATVAGLVNQNAPATLPHSVGYTLSHRYNLPHGASCAIPLPYCMRYNLSMCVDKFVVIGGYFGITSSSKREIALKTIEAIRRLIEDLDVPISLKELGVPRAQLPILAREFIEKYPRPYNICKIDVLKAEKLYRYMWEGTVW
jgi:alcohol dehydrogenase class IV